MGGGAASSVGEEAELATRSGNSGSAEVEASLLPPSVNDERKPTESVMRLARVPSSSEPESASVVVAVGASVASTVAVIDSDTSSEAVDVGSSIGETSTTLEEDEDAEAEMSVEFEMDAEASVAVDTALTAAVVVVIPPGEVVDASTSDTISDVAESDELTAVSDCNGAGLEDAKSELVTALPSLSESDESDESDASEVGFEDASDADAGAAVLLGVVGVATGPAWLSVLGVAAGDGLGVGVDGREEGEILASDGKGAAAELELGSEVADDARHQVR